MTATLPDYANFLASKKRRAHDAGHNVDPDDLHPRHFPHQRAIVRWAVRKGNAAVFLDTGLGKSAIQLEWLRHMPGPGLIVAPLSVGRQTVREAAVLDMEVVQVRRPAADRWTITNYENLGHFDPSAYGSVVFDESSIIKQHDSKTRQRLCREWSAVPYKLACTATPAPNDVAELANHSELLGALPRAEMLASFFVHDDDGWRLKGHAVEEMWRWVSTWAVAARHPGDLGFLSKGYDLPPLRIHEEVVECHIESPDQLFATDLGGVGGRAAVRRQTMDARAVRSIDIAKGIDEQVIVWCGLNEESSTIARTLGSDCVEVTGSDSPEHKAEAIERFQDGAVRVLVSKASICGFGVNLQNCARQVFCGLNDSYEAEYQAVRRSYRFGQTRPVNVHLVVSELERQIVANVRRKEANDRSRVDRLVPFSRDEMEPYR